MDDSNRVAQKFNERSRRAARNASVVASKQQRFPLSCATGAITGVVEEEQLPVRLQLPAGNEDTTDVTGLDTDENGPNTVTNVIVGTFSSSLSFTGNDGPVGLIPSCRSWTVRRS